MTTCPLCGERIPIEGCAEHAAWCGLPDDGLPTTYTCQHGTSDYPCENERCRPARVLPLVVIR